MVMELARYNFSRSDVDAKGAAYQEIVGANLRGDRGQYFTPRRAVDLVVRILAPKDNERVLDPACGTGWRFMSRCLHTDFVNLRSEYKRELGDATQDSILDSLRDYANKNVFGADFDPFLVRASTMNLCLWRRTLEGQHLPHGFACLPTQSPARKRCLPRNTYHSDSVDVLMTNPPFGSEIPISEPEILESHQLALPVSPVPATTVVAELTTHA